MSLKRKLLFLLAPLTAAGMGGLALTAVPVLAATGSPSPAATASPGSGMTTHNCPGM